MAAFPDGYRAYKSFMVRNTYIDEDLANVRLLVRIASDADIGALARPDGYDLRFTTADGSTLIDPDVVAMRPRCLVYRHPDTKEWIVGQVVERGGLR